MSVEVEQEQARVMLMGILLSICEKKLIMSNKINFA